VTGSGEAKPEHAPGGESTAESGAAGSADPRVLSGRACIGIASFRLRRLPHLPAFLPEADRIVPLHPFARVDAVAGWGLKARSRGARRFAARHSLPYLALEDGFLRSLRPGVAGDPPLSVSVDATGVYYDASRPSRIEALLAAEGWDTPALLARARAGIRALIERRLSKYNDAPMPSGSLARRLAGPFVLVVDQTRADASVAYGLADETTFTRMLEAAIAENPGTRILVKTHPDVALGRRQGYLTAARGRHVEVIAERVNPWALLEGARAVYTVTSQLGAEAVLAGLRVRCFGMPFYAGWGLTEDAIALTRRTRRVSAEHLFAAGWLICCRYADPFTGEPSDFERTAETIALWRDTAEANRGPVICVGFSPWKRRRVRAFLGFGGTRVRFLGEAGRGGAAARAGGGRIVAWASRMPADLPERAATAGVALARMEDGFIRSAGLGAGLIPPASLVLDHQGIYYDPAVPSTLETMLAERSFPPALIARARGLIRAIVAGRVSKYNLSGAAVPADWPRDRPRVLVPGQVEDDASILLGARGVTGNAALLATVRAARPEAFLIWKPHPDVVAGYRAGAVDAAFVQRHADAVATDIPMPALLDAVDEVHTITSLTGFEALLRGVHVVCWGAPFYAGWGLTEDHVALPRRGRRRSLEELVAAALILYPRYLDPETLLPCGPELVVRRLAAASPPPPRGWRAHLARLNAALFRGVRR
jgi:capsular polysaccharide export protein